MAKVQAHSHESQVLVWDADGADEEEEVISGVREKGCKCLMEEGAI